MPHQKDLFPPSTVAPASGEAVMVVVVYHRDIGDLERVTHHAVGGGECDLVCEGLYLSDGKHVGGWPTG